MEVRKAQLGTICFIVPRSPAISEAAGEQGWTSRPIRGTPVAAGAEGRDDMSVEALRTDSELSCWSCCRRLSSEQLSADFSNKKKTGLCVCVFVWARLLQSRDNDSLFAGRMVGGMNWERETKMQKFDGRPCCQYLSCLCLFMNAAVSGYMDTSYFSFTSTTCCFVVVFPLIIPDWNSS